MDHSATIRRLPKAILLHSEKRGAECFCSLHFSVFHLSEKCKIIHHFLSFYQSCATLCRSSLTIPIKYVCGGNVTNCRVVKRDMNIFASRRASRRSVTTPPARRRFHHQGPQASFHLLTASASAGSLKLSVSGVLMTAHFPSIEVGKMDDRLHFLTIQVTKLP